MIEYMIEVDYERMVTLHINIPLFNTQMTVNDVGEHDLFDGPGIIGTTEVYHVEMGFGNRFMLFKEELKKIKGVDSIDVNRFEICIFKGKIFSWKDIIDDVMYLLLCFYDVSDGKAELIEFEIKKEAKKQIKCAKRDEFKKAFPKTYDINLISKNFND